MSLSKGLPLIHSASRILSLSRSYYSRPALANVSQDKHASYFIPRNSQGSLPVYSDIRNGGTRYLVLVKNIRGNIHALRNDLVSSLFESGSPNAAHLNAEIKRNDTIVVTGGRWKHDVMDWLRRKGF